jgi:hypothetical protein
MFQPTDELSVTMTAAEWNQVLQILGKVAYEVSAPLIDKIRGQGMSQNPAPNSREIPHVPH